MKRLSLALGLLVACAAVHQPLVAKLFQVDPDKLHKYAYKGDLKSVEKALAKGADINGQGKWIGALRSFDGTPLHAAARGARIEVAKYLLDNGATVDEKNEGRYTPLHYAAQGSGDSYEGLRDYVGMAQLLITNGAGLDAKTGRFDTALHIVALRGGGKKMARLLIDSGANPYIRNNAWDYPYQAARKRLYFVIAKILDPEGRYKKDKAVRKAARKEKRREGRVEFFRKVGVRD